jgi:hypothetical protein
MLRDLAYSEGQDAAKLAFFGELYDKHIKGNMGPLAAGLFTSDPVSAGLGGMVGQLADTPPEGSHTLRALGIGAGAAGANLIAAPIMNKVLGAIVSAVGGVGHPVAQMALTSAMSIPTSIAQSYAAGLGRRGAVHAENYLKEKGVNIP